MAELSSQHKQVRVIAIIAIVLSLGILAVVTAVWGVLIARPLPVRVERREVVATIARRGIVVAPPSVPVGAEAGPGGLVVQVNLGPVEAAAVHSGDEAVLTSDMMGHVVLRGRVTRITQTQSPMAPWPAYQVLIQTPGGESMAQPMPGMSMPGMTIGAGMAPGLSIDVVITVSRVAGALAVPNDALVRSANGEFSVEVLRRGEWRMVPVQVGLRGDDYTEIRRGLQEGEIVRLTPGVPGAR